MIVVRPGDDFAAGIGGAIVLVPTSFVFRMIGLVGMGAGTRVRQHASHAKRGQAYKGPAPRDESEITKPTHA
ncbi:MAG: hypothetical protein A49_16140 [Methyloceanibacter sp.]|nr:MAG: hypothetical protein A49_16140 [Methyloceanibacter sp.]